MTLTNGHDRDMASLRTAVARLNEGGLSWADIHAESGIPVGTLSPWVAAKYTGNNEAVARRVEKWLATRKEHKAVLHNSVQAPGFVETPTATAILTRLKFAHAIGDFALVTGGPGIGKTSAFEYYRTQAPQVHLVTLSPATGGVAGCLIEILHQLKCKPPVRTPEAMYRAVCDRLSGTTACLIVDEAQFAADPAIEILRSIHDGAAIALVLAGNEDLTSRFAGGRGRGVHAQVRSRIGARFSTFGAGKGDIALLAAGWGVTTRSCVTFLERVGQTPGALRSVVKTIRLASVLAGDKTIDKTLLETAWNQLGATA